MEPFALKRALDNVRATTPLVHNITNYVTVNDCANALLAIGASPIMSDEPADVEDITSICGGLTLNIGTLNERSIRGMFAAGERASELGHPIVFDPVGAGAGLPHRAEGPHGGHPAVPDQHGLLRPVGGHSADGTVAVEDFLGH